MLLTCSATRLSNYLVQRSDTNSHALKTFGTENCSFYEHYADEPIYLRYWRIGDRVLRPADLLALDSDRFALVRQIASGFTVSDAHLGTCMRERTRAVILDHAVRLKYKQAAG